MNFHSEYGEDQWIAGHIILPDNGVYVDVGAAQPTVNSNTAFVRDIGWTGVAIDANPAYWPMWKTPFEVAIVSNEPEVGFDIDYNNYSLSRVSQYAKKFQAVTLESILEKHGIGKIDLLSLDVEGHELSALLSMDIVLHDPTIIISEYSTLGLGEDFGVKELLESLGYQERHRTVANIIYWK